LLSGAVSAQNSKGLSITVGSAVKEIKKATPTEAVDSCANLTKCDACIADPTCGWCVTSRTCMKGYISGPAQLPSAAATCGEWMFATCPTRTCSGYLNCDLCTQNPNCGWCMNTRGDKCVEGTSAGTKYPSYDNCTYFRYGSCVEDPEQISPSTTALFFPKPVKNVNSPDDEIVGVVVEDEQAGENTVAEPVVKAACKRSNMLASVAARESEGTKLAGADVVTPQELTAVVYEKPETSEELQETPILKISNESMLNLIAAEPLKEEGAGSLLGDDEPGQSEAQDTTDAQNQLATNSDDK